MVVVKTHVPPNGVRGGCAVFGLIAIAVMLLVLLWPALQGMKRQPARSPVPPAPTTEATADVPAGAR